MMLRKLRIIQICLAFIIDMALTCSRDMIDDTIHTNGVSGYRILYSLHPSLNFTYNSVPFPEQPTTESEATKNANDAFNKTLNEILTEYGIALKKAPIFEFQNLFDSPMLLSDVDPSDPTKTKCESPIVANSRLVDPSSHFVLYPCNANESQDWPPFVEFEVHFTKPQNERNLNEIFKQLPNYIENDHAAEIVSPIQITPLK